MMSSQEDINESIDCPPSDIFKPKKKPKIIRVLTVMAYVLSVSMAAILLSIYYIFMWRGRPHMGAYSSDKIENPVENDNSSIFRYYFNFNLTQNDVLKKIENETINSSDNATDKVDEMEVVRNIQKHIIKLGEDLSMYKTEDNVHSKLISTLGPVTVNAIVENRSHVIGNAATGSTSREPKFSANLTNNHALSNNNLVR